MRSGGQLPTFEKVGDFAYSDSQDAIDMFEAYGRRYYDAQKYEMGLFYARKSDGSYAARSIAISKPRQNGKSFAARDYALDSACMDGKRVLYSAHNGKTVRDMFKEMCAFIEMQQDFKEEVDYIYKAAPVEGIYFTDGGCIEFQTRTTSGARGGTYDIVIIDEAQELTAAQQEALLPTISAAQELIDAKGTQVIYLGTPPGEKCIGTVFRELHDRAHVGDTDTWWVEWAAQGKAVTDIDLDDIDLWYATNPAMGRRMSEATVRNERDTMSPVGFARERLGWWSPVTQVYHPITADDWDACLTDDPPKDGGLVYAVKFSHDGAVGTLAVCLKPKDGAPHVEVIDCQSMAYGLDWIASWLIERRDKALAIVVDGQSHSDELCRRLKEGGVKRRKIQTVRTRDLIAATSAFCNAVRERGVTHYRDDALTISATKCVRRRIGSDGGFGFSSVEDAEETLIEACCLAYWAAINAKTNERKPRVNV